MPSEVSTSASALEPLRTTPVSFAAATVARSEPAFTSSDSKGSRRPPGSYFGAGGAAGGGVGGVAGPPQPVTVNATTKPHADRIQARITSPQGPSAQEARRRAGTYRLQGRVPHGWVRSLSARAAPSGPLAAPRC